MLDKQSITPTERHINRQIDLWHDEHVNFAKLLELLDRQLSTLRLAQRSDYELMADIIYYLGEYSDRYHHPREDAAFERLLRRDPSLELQINRLYQEHRVIVAAGLEVSEDLQRVCEDAIVPREELEKALAVYITYYRHHMYTEESKIMPLADRILTPEDWEEVSNAIPAEKDPLFGAAAYKRFEKLRQHLAAESASLRHE